MSEFIPPSARQGGGDGTSVGLSKGAKVPAGTTVTIIPSADRRTLDDEQRVKIKQTLGGTVTVELTTGELARLDRNDAVELGLVEPHEAAPPIASAGEFTLDAVWQVLDTVYDPEIPVSIVELGLVYEVVEEPTDDGRHDVSIDMTVTAPFCNMGDVIKADVVERVGELPGVGTLTVNVVLDPPWDQSRLSPVAKLELGLM